MSLSAGEVVLKLVKKVTADDPEKIKEFEKKQEQKKQNAERAKTKKMNAELDLEIAEESLVEAAESCKRSETTWIANWRAMELEQKEKNLKAAEQKLARLEKKE